MANNFRVDRVDSKSVPCGMNSVLYIGDNSTQAHKAFDNAETGIDSWGKQNSRYGVVFSVWNEQKRDYVIKRWKGLD